MSLRFRDRNGARRRWGLEGSRERREGIVDNDRSDGEIFESVLGRPGCRRR